MKKIFYSLFMLPVLSYLVLAGAVSNASAPSVSFSSNSFTFHRPMTNVDSPPKFLVHKVISMRKIGMRVHKFDVKSIHSIAGKMRRYGYTDGKVPIYTNRAVYSLEDNYVYVDYNSSSDSKVYVEFRSVPYAQVEFIEYPDHRRQRLYPFGFSYRSNSFNVKRGDNLFRLKVKYPMGTYGEFYITIVDKKTGNRYVLDPWWDYSWKKRKEIVLSNIQSNVSDLQVALNVSYSDGMKDDFSDIRFTYYNSSDDSEVSIPYWLESYEVNSSAIVWVKVPYLSSDENATLYMYYDNPSVLSASNITDVFLFGDDFSGTGLDTVKWDNNGASGLTVSNGYAEFSWSANSVSPKIKSKFSLNPTHGIPFRVDYRLKYKQSGDVDGADGNVGVCLSSDPTTTSSKRALHLTSGGDDYYVDVAGDGSYNVYGDYVSVSDDVWYNESIIVNGYSTTFIHNDQSYHTSYGYYDAPLTLYLPSYLYDSSADSKSGDVVFDYIYIRKYVSFTPNFTFGSPESAVKKPLYNVTSYGVSPDKSLYSEGEIMTFWAKFENLNTTQNKTYCYWDFNSDGVFDHISNMTDGECEGSYARTYGAYNLSASLYLFYGTAQTIPVPANRFVVYRYSVKPRKNSCPYNPRIQSFEVLQEGLDGYKVRIRFTAKDDDGDPLQYHLLMVSYPYNTINPKFAQVVVNTTLSNNTFETYVYTDHTYYYWITASDGRCESAPSEPEYFDVYNDGGKTHFNFSDSRIVVLGLLVITGGVIVSFVKK